MRGWLALAGAIDRMNDLLARLAVWAVFISCMVSALNASSRYLFDASSNAWLEVQWYLFAVTVMFGAAFVLRVNEHVRVDVIYGNLAPRRRAWVDLLGLLFFLMPACLLTAWMAWPWFLESYANHEMSNNAGGLLRWPVKMLLPVGFAVLALQGVAEIIKRIGYLRGVHHMDTHYERPLQ